MNKTKIAAKRPRKRDGLPRRNPPNGADRNGASANGNRPRRPAKNLPRKREIDQAIQRFVDLYKFAPIGYVSLNPSGRLEEINIAAARLLGAPRNELIGTPFAVRIARTDVQKFFRHLLVCRSGEPGVETELRLKRPDGRNPKVLLSSTPTFSVKNNAATVYETAIVDLTERERAEAALREKEAQLERVVSQTPFMLTRCTRSLRYRYVSHAYAKMLGRTSEELTGKPIVEIIGKQALNVISPYIDNVLNGKYVEYEEDVPLRRVGMRRLHTIYSPDLDEHGNIIGWIASIADITERQRTEIAAMRLASLVRSSHDAVVAKDLNGIITDWNKSAERIFGYTAKEMAGKSILTLIPQDRQQEETEILRKIRRGESIDHYETIRQRKDGQLIDVALTISPIKSPDGKIIGVSKIARDNSKQKKAERLLSEQARLLDLSTEAILVRDKHDRITYWSQGATELYGYSPEEAVAKITHQLLRTEHPERLAQIYKILERDGRWRGELVHKRKDGSKIVVMSHWALDRDKSDQHAYLLETNTDITQLKRAEAALRRSKGMLEELVQQRTRALRSANAELQTEIARRQGLEGQILEISDREQERLGQELHDGLCQQLTAIGFLTRATALRLKDHRVVQVDDLDRIAQLINSSVMDARNIARDLHKEQIDAAEFESALRDLVDRKIWKTSCRLDLKTDISIESDRTASELYRILREAIINANKHSRATQIVLAVKRSKKALLFTVRDNGIGFSSKKSEGLGFHIMKYRAESIGARLELESLKKGGARVTCSLPITMLK